MLKNWVEEAIAAVYDSEYGGDNIADEHHRTLPMPRVEDGKQLLAVAFCLREAPGGDSALVYPPSYLAQVLYRDTGTIAWKKTVPTDFNLKSKSDKPLGDLNKDKNLVSDEYQTHESDYCGQIELVLENEWLLGKNTGTKLEKNVANTLRKLLPLVKEAAIQEYYDWAERDLKKWLDSIR